MTCIVVRILVQGEQTAGGAAGGLMDSWDNFEERKREEKREHEGRRTRERENEELVVDK